MSTIPELTAADMIRSIVGAASVYRYNESGPGGAGNTCRSLTHLLDSTERQAAVKATRKPCSAPGCTRPSRRRLYCGAHLDRLQFAGNLMASEPIRDYPTAAERDDIATRIMKQTVRTESGCIEWTGTKKVGYGRIGWRGKDWMAHRAIWTYLVGPIPSGQAPDGSEWTLDHLCFNRACVNVDHLEVVSRIENARRAGGLAKAHESTRLKSRQSEPPHGNLQRYRRLGCRCDLCRAANAASARARRQAKAVAK